MKTAFYRVKQRLNWYIVRFSGCLFGSNSVFEYLTMIHYPIFTNRLIKKKLQLPITIISLTNKHSC